MIVSIIFLILFFIVAGLLILFVYSVLIPAIQTGNQFDFQNYLFADDELKHIACKKTELIEKPFRAVVLCHPDKTFESRRMEYNGIMDCSIFDRLYQTEYDCIYQCLGFGSCQKVCPQQAITIINGTAVVQEGCIGCGRCVDVCPKNIIKLVSVDSQDQIIFCCAENGDTSCSSYQKNEKMIVQKRKIFKFWYLCCKIFHINKHNG